MKLKRSRGDMTSLAHNLTLLAVLSFIAVANAGPLGPLPNVTSSDLGLKEGSCAIGDVVYMPGDVLPGSSACERCSCEARGVRCSRQACEPRPGCKALHRPDHCCPTYQCECEQEGRIYGNGEKLVDPADPCRVCYCQGGEVVCRRIACFVRDDCQPRLVPGRCCPEYDNCPLRGVATAPGIAASIPSVSPVENIGSSVMPPIPKENIKQEITIKEITPVSEIPIITDVKIKEILPSPSIEVPEYSSSKAPLIPREATSEKSVSSEEITKTETPVIIEIKSPSVPTLATSHSSDLSIKSKEFFGDIKTTDDSSPSKISLSTQDSINSDIYPSNIPSVATVGPILITSDAIPVIQTTKAPSVIEEEDSSLFDHNPAFPPLPDDLSVLSNHDDEIPSEQEVNVPIAPLVTEASTIRDSAKTTSKYNSETSFSTEKLMETTTITSGGKLNTVNSDIKESPMLNLRSAIPTEILSLPSLVPEDITGELDDVTVYSTTSEKQMANIATTESFNKLDEKRIEQELHTKEDISKIYSTTTVASIDFVTGASATAFIDTRKPNNNSDEKQTNNTREQTTSSIAKSNIATEASSQMELSSLPIETSNQKPQESEQVFKEKSVPTITSDHPNVDEAISRTSTPEPELIILPKEISPNTEDSNIDYTTEFTLFNSPEAVTDTESIELVNVFPDTQKKAAIIQTGEEKNNVLKDLIKLVDDVASISDHTDLPESTRRTTASAIISESEELIPVNAGYKSKNNNWNLNSITEIPLKSKNPTQTKQKIIEIEDEGESIITDSSSPNDKVEPTTRRPIIDNVSDDMPENRTEKKDIEIITQSYVPTINKRPTKVVMKKERVTSAETTEGRPPAPTEVAATVAAEVTESTPEQTSTAETTAEQ